MKKLLEFESGNADTGKVTLAYYEDTNTYKLISCKNANAVTLSAKQMKRFYHLLNDSVSLYQ